MSTTDQYTVVQTPIHTIVEITIPENVQSFLAHPIAECWTLIEERDFQALCQSVESNGLLTPIVLYEGKILDGRNRYRACMEKSIPPTFKEYVGNDPYGYALACNEHRRHLGKAQRASIAAKLSNLTKGRPDKSVNSQNKPFTQAEAAAKLDVSVSAVKEAKTVFQKGEPKLQDAMAKNKISTSLAEKIATQATPEQQNAIVEAVEQGKKPSEAVKAALPSSSKPTPKEQIANLTDQLKWMDSATEALKARLGGAEIQIRAQCDAIDNLEELLVILRRDLGQRDTWLADTDASMKLLEEERDQYQAALKEALAELELLKSGKNSGFNDDKGSTEPLSETDANQPVNPEPVNPEPVNDSEIQDILARLGL